MVEKNKYFWQIISQYVDRLKKGSKVDSIVQSFYNQYLYGYDNNSDANLLIQLQNYNLCLDDPYLATGQCSYFDEQIRENGLSIQKLISYDYEDAKFISQCFGKENHYSDNNVPITYATLLGTTEFNYATQTFPAGIFEDVFQCNANHEWPIQPMVGELEKDFYLRLLEYQIDNSSDFLKEKKEEVLYRGKRLIEKFCSGKSKVYLIKMSDALKLKASFGDVTGLRDGKLNGNDAQSEIDKLQSLNELMTNFRISKDCFYSDLNMCSEYGIALYGTVPFSSLKYIEVESKYNVIQKRALDFGYSIGEVIPSNFDVQLDVQSNYSR